MSLRRPSPLRSSDATWLTSSIIDTEMEPRQPPASSLDLVPAPRASDLQIILRTRDHAAYYDPSLNELSLQKRDPLRSSHTGPSPADAPLVPHRNGNAGTSQSLLQRFTRASSISSSQHQHETLCPTCARPWAVPQEDPLNAEYDEGEPDPHSPSFIAPNYFRLLAQATRPPPPLSQSRFSSASGTSTPHPPSTPLSAADPISSTSEAPGYYSRFFLELKPLGRGARGQVFLCQHILNGNPLGKYAIKKIPVGDHAQSLLASLNEVHLMESLRHENLVHYQHAWIERSRVSKWAPEVPTLFVLMMAANGGSLDDWISARAGEQADSSPRTTGEEAQSDPSTVAGASHGANVVGEAVNDRRKVERLKAALRQRRANRHTSPSDPCVSSAPQPDVGAGVGVHLLRLDEIYSLLTDITCGLSFLHDRGILHLDIKPGNVLLHWDEDSLMPRALLSDFGSSLLLHDSYTRTRSGHTGTMEYMSPETIKVDPKTGKLSELSSKADIWSLGMILHLLLFFRLPYGQTKDVDRLRKEMEGYKGFKRGQCGREGKRRGDEVLLGLLERMLSVEPGQRPSAREVLQMLKSREEGQRKEKKQRRASQPDHDEENQDGVSLALYRPAALPPLPLPSRGESSALSSVSPRASVVDKLSKIIPPETLPIAIAFLKCLSPAPVSRAVGRSSGQWVLVSDSASVLILLMALIDLSVSLRPHDPQRRWISASCWFSHLSLLLYQVVVT